MHMERLLPMIGLALFATGVAQAADCPDWSATQARQELGALHDRLDGWNHAYRIGGQSPVDDAVYDQAQKRLAQWSRCFPSQAPAPLSSRVSELIQCQPSARVASTSWPRSVTIVPTRTRSSERLTSASAGIRCTFALERTISCGGSGGSLRQR